MALIWHDVLQLLELLVILIVLIAVGFLIVIDIHLVFFLLQCNF